jgi:hypothetical protein
MATVEERMRILKMVEGGQISAEEGAKLLAALRGSARPKTPSTPGQAKWFRVRVMDLDSGIKMGARFAPEVEGLDFDEIMEAIRSGVQGKIVDVVNEEDGEKIEILIE